MSFQNIERKSNSGPADSEINALAEETPGLKAEQSVLAFLETRHKFIIFTRVEPTKKNGVNDRNHVDAFVWLNDKLPCAVDITGATGDRRNNKKEIEAAMPLVRRHDEMTGKPISDEMPHFTLDVNLGYWDMLTTKMRNGVSIEKAMNPKEETGVQKNFLGQMWLQINRIERRAGADRKKIAPYKEALSRECKEVFSKADQAVLGIY